MWFCSVARLPLYVCKKVEDSGEKAREPPVAFLESLVLGEVKRDSVLSFCCLNEYQFISVLVFKWEDRYQRGLFRYDLTACVTKVHFFSSLTLFSLVKPIWCFSLLFLGHPGEVWLYCSA